MPCYISRRSAGSASVYVAKYTPDKVEVSIHTDAMYTSFNLTEAEARKFADGLVEIADKSLVKDEPVKTGTDPF